MITPKDFERLLKGRALTWLHADSESDAGEAGFELAKLMAMEFAKHCSTSGYYYDAGKDLWHPKDTDDLSKTTEQLFADFNPAPEKKVLFKTADGFEYFDGMEIVFCVLPNNGGWRVVEYNAMQTLDFDAWLRFKHRENAEKYILENKPVFSVNQIKEASTSPEKFQEFVKSLSL